ncbi:hypothetical protein Mgra_00005282 [Meloidogyne graminicola]|uniref:Uncharacterized protein n=1 Tax=Meloidogyne graminicola TaxID=189291 RepID=A0A8S9ZPF1_9BILA|nr:hypothetical protein Mgra_00005282 [Meloidogyne graminicola]
MSNQLFKTKLSYLTLFRTFCANQPSIRKMEVFSLEPMTSTQKAYLREQFELNYIEKGQSLEINFQTKRFLGPNELEIFIDQKKMKTIPKLYEIIGGKASDARYTSPPGKPKGAEARIFSNEDSPVYQGIARKLGYKPLKGFQHP